jgi:hypothetical protein
MIPLREPRKSTKPVPTSAAVELPPKEVLTRNFFAPLRTTDMDTNTTGAEKTLPKQEAPRNPGRPPPIVMTSTTNLIRFQRDLKRPRQERVRVPKYTKWNPYNNKRNGGLAMKSYLEKNNFHYFTFPQILKRL